MRIKIDGEIRREKMSKATRIERIFVMPRDIARCRSPKRAYDFVLGVLKLGLENEKDFYSKEEVLEINKEIERVSKMTPEDFYEELKRIP